MPRKKGYKMSEETKRKISEANKGKQRTPEMVERMRVVSTGKTHSPETCKKISENHADLRGDKSHFWKGGKTKDTQILRCSAQYVAWRKAVFDRDGYTCKVCSAHGCALQAHHIIHVSDDITKSTDIDNGITLCKPCHAKEHPDINLFKR